MADSELICRTCEGERRSLVSRRAFIKGGGVAMLGLSSLPDFLFQAVAATPQQVARNRKILVVLFQRGAMDGLNAVIPFAEPNYYSLRPTIAIPQPARGKTGETAIDLDGFFGLHPRLSPLEPLFRDRSLAIVHASGSPDATRSHFDAQDYMESGTPGRKSTEDGWLNRALRVDPEEATSPFRAVAMGQNLPRTLSGPASAVAMSDIRQFQVMTPSTAASGGFEALYSRTVDQALKGTGTETFEAIEMLRKSRPQDYQPENGAAYPGNRFGQSLLQIAQFIKADVGLEVAFLDSGGWDHHVNEGSVQGQLANLLGQLGQGIAAFHKDLGSRMQNVVFVTLSEFGRTAHENGNRGTDHGHANCMFILGGDVQGGKVYGKWPGLDRARLYEDRDLAVTTDFRTVLGEIISSHLGAKDLNSVFPAFANDPRAFLHFMKV